MRRLRPSAIPPLPVAFDAAVELDWGDPVMNRRLLREHLDQGHDGASRRLPTIERHVARLARLLPAPPGRLLDAACGPGLYAIRLARLGWDVVGVDTGAAVLRHARILARDAGLALDLRRADLGSLELDAEFDAVILVYYILEAFPRRRQVDVLRRLAAALRPGGRLIAELRVRPEQPPGRITGWDVVPRSLLSDRPHLLLTDTVYDERRHTFVLREIAVLDDGGVEIQQTTGRLVTLAEVPGLFARAGLAVRAVHDGWSRYRATGLSDTLLVVAERQRQAEGGRPRRT
ncbi:MAG: class I SAM-dependent methyltransferase [Chloroflexi bacterium]|nr:MAG: class I SAM-dependent methyltransferase [Chloroflexota bacterium]